MTTVGMTLSALATAALLTSRVRCNTTVALIGNDAAAAADEPGRGGLPAVTAPAATTAPRGLVTGAEMPACWDDEGL